MIKLNCGNLWTDAYLDEVIRLNSDHKDIKIKSLFGSVAGLTPTARSIDRLPKIDLDDVPAYCKKAQDNDIAVRYTLNQSCIGPMQDFYPDWKEVMRGNLAWLHNTCGVHEWTVTSPLIVELLRMVFPDDFIEVSTIAEVSTPTDALRWKNLGASGVNLSTSINRDFPRMREISTILQVSLLANEACLYRCPWRRECYNLSSHNSARSSEFFDHYPFSRCNSLRIKEPVEWLKARMILPQWMTMYQEKTGVQWFKIAYRTHPIETAMPILKSYMGGQFGGNLVELWPSIAKLGDTADPRDITCIPCSRLDSFLDHWVMGDTCEDLACGTGCRYCYEFYKRIAGR